MKKNIAKIILLTVSSLAITATSATEAKAAQKFVNFFKKRTSQQPILQRIEQDNKEFEESFFVGGEQKTPKSSLTFKTTETKEKIGHKIKTKAMAWFNKFTNNKKKTEKIDNLLTKTENTIDLERPKAETSKEMRAIEKLLTQNEQSTQEIKKKFDDKELQNEISEEEVYVKELRKINAEVLRMTNANKEENNLKGKEELYSEKDEVYSKNDSIFFDINLERPKAETPNEQSTKEIKKKFDDKNDKNEFAEQCVKVLPSQRYDSLYNKPQTEDIIANNNDLEEYNIGADNNFEDLLKNAEKFLELDMENGDFNDLEEKSAKLQNNSRELTDETIEKNEADYLNSPKALLGAASKTVESFINKGKEVEQFSKETKLNAQIEEELVSENDKNEFAKQNEVSSENDKNKFAEQDEVSSEEELVSENNKNEFAKQNEVSSENDLIFSENNKNEFAKQNEVSSEEEFSTEEEVDTDGEALEDPLKESIALTNFLNPEDGDKDEDSDELNEDVAGCMNTSDESIPEEERDEETSKDNAYFSDGNEDENSGHISSIQYSSSYVKNSDSQSKIYTQNKDESTDSVITEAQLAKDLKIATSDELSGQLSRNEKAEIYNEISFFSKKAVDQFVKLQALDVNMMIDDMTNYIVDSRLVAVGVAAGDDEKTKIEKGVWIKALYGVGNQNKLGKMSGYNSNSFGAIIGGDIELDDDKLFGVAISNIKSNFKFKNDKSSDRAKASTIAVSLYGSKNITDHIFMNGAVNIVYSDIKVRALKQITANVEKVEKYADSKFSSIGASVNFNLNYLKRFQSGNSLTPVIGIKYSKNVDSGFTEKGTGLYNLTAASRKKSSLITKFGASFNFAPIKKVGLIITPGIKAVINRQVSLKADKLKAKLNWQGNQYEQEISIENRQKTAVNLGVGVAVTKGMVDIMANYDYTLKKQFKSHEGSLKLRVNL